MANLYNSNITTRIIDAVFEKKLFRSEYRLQADTLYLANFRLAGLGVESTPAQALNGLLGQLSCIKSIQLYDGNQLLSQQNQASIYNAFKALRHDNDENISLNQTLSRNDLGYVTTGNQQYDATTGYSERDDVKITSQEQYNNSANKAWFSLGDLLPFLKSSFYVPTNVYKRLRLVINWKSASELKDVVGEDRTSTLSTYENVTLVVDEMNMSDQRESMMKSYEGLVWSEVEVDSVDIPAVTGITADSVKPQANSFLVNGFNGKKLQKVLMVQTPTDSATWVNGNANSTFSNQGSKALHDAKYQVRVNGSNKIPRANWEGGNRRLGHLVDAYGEMNTIIGQNVTYLKEGANYIEDADTLGQLDYTGLVVDENISELVVNVDRTGVDGNVDLNQRIRLNLFGEVQKAVVMRDNETYNVIYTD
tara:strand:- start:880 stop:2142 length:1263 start_codon:yes stop_codon:yes gene_type:complete